MNSDEQRYWDWMNEIDEIAADMAGQDLSATVSAIQEQVLDDDDFIQYLWEQFTYLRGNIYVKVPGREEPVCLHRDIDPRTQSDVEGTARQIQVPWLKAFRCPNGTLTLDPLFEAIEPLDKVERVMGEERYEREERIGKKGSSSRFLVEWLDDSADARGKTILVVSEGEMVFYRLFASADYQPDERQIHALREWLNTKLGTHYLHKLPRHQTPSQLVDRVMCGGFRPEPYETERIQSEQRINPEVEIDVLHNRNIVFFPAGEIRNSSAVRRVFCLLSVYDEVGLVSPKLHRLVNLFKKIAHIGVEYSQQALASAQDVKFHLNMDWELTGHSIRGPASRIDALLDRLRQDDLLDVTYYSKLKDHVGEILAAFSLHEDIKHPERLTLAIQNGEGITVSGLVETLESIWRDVWKYGDECWRASSGERGFDSTLNKRLLTAPVVSVPDDMNVYFHLNHDKISGHDYSLIKNLLWEELLNACKHSRTVSEHMPPLPILCTVYVAKREGKREVRIRIANATSTGSVIPWAEILGNEVALRQYIQQRRLTVYRYHQLLRGSLNDFFYREVAEKASAPSYGSEMEFSAGHRVNGDCEALLKPLFGDVEPVHHNSAYDELQYYWVEISLREMIGD